ETSPVVAYNQKAWPLKPGTVGKPVWGVEVEILASRREVAVGLGWLGHWEEAMAAYHTVAEARARVLGADHPDTLASRNDEAHCLEQLGRGTEAVELYRQVAALRQGAAGP
ncbi:tetratricopeptide repeat protein, partial [Streptomyces sp. NPDC002454]